MNTALKGKMGEDLCAKYLRDNGYVILKRNFRSRSGEIDIIAKRGSHLSFVEVKTRKNTNFGHPCDAVDYHKQQKIISTARTFLVSYTDYEDISFDVCEVYTDERCINYIQGAFEA